MLKETSPAYCHQTVSSMADRFYEMHTICETELELNLRQKHLISLGYLLYSSPDGFMIGSHLKNIDPGLYKDLHKTMVLVCRSALWTIARTQISIGPETLDEYQQVMVALESRLCQLKRAMG